jgi:hypothetical protein
MPQPIKKSDIIENDILKSVIVEFEQAKKVTEDYNRSLKETAGLLKTKLSDSKIFDSTSVKEHNMAIKEANMLFNQKLKAEEQLKKNAILEEKIVAQQIRNQQLINRETEKEIKAKTRLDSIYMKFNDKLSKTRNEYRELAIRKVAFNNLNAKEEIKLAALEKRVQMYDTTLKKVDATMGMHQRNVGNYASGNATLSNSINQLTREMPAFANSIGTGFMAISNNLPIFFDEINKLKKANIELKKAGEPTKNVLKEVAGSIFSVGTALSIGVTLLTLYGAKIVEYVGNLFKASKSTDTLTNSFSKLASATREQNKEVAEETSEYIGLLYQLKLTNNGSKERKELIDKINSTYGTTLQNMQDEIQFQKQLALAVTDYIELKRSEYTLEKNEEKRQLVLQKEANAKERLRLIKDEIKTAQDDLKQAKERVYDVIGVETGREGVAAPQEIAYQRQIEKQKKLNDLIFEQKTLKETLVYTEKRLIALAGSDIDLEEKRNQLMNGGLVPTGKTTKTTKEKIQEIKDYTREIEDERIRLMTDSLGKEQLIIYKRETRRIEDIKKELGDEKQKAVLIKEIETNMIAEILQLEENFYKDQAKKRKENMESLLSELDELDKQTYEHEVASLEEIKKTREKNLLESNATDEDIKKISIQNEIDYLEEKIKLAEKYGQDTLDLEVELAKLRRTETEKIAVTNYKFLGDMVKQYTELEIAQSQKRIAQLDKEIANRQKNYDLYTELAKNGNITAQQSLAEEQKAIVEANKKKEVEMKRQQRLKFAESTFSAYASNVDKGEKNPLLKTITDMTLLRQFIMSLPAFEKGIEDTGVNGKGIDGKGGFLSILHPNERVLTKEQNSMMSGLSNDEVSETIAKYRSGQLVNIKNVDVAGNSFDIAPLLSEIKDLKNVIKQKPETNIQLGEITQHAMTIVETKTKGNTRINNKYIVR